MEEPPPLLRLLERMESARFLRAEVLVVVRAERYVEEQRYHRLEERLLSMLLRDMVICCLEVTKVEINRLMDYMLANSHGV